jgi:hypothetical protein
MIVCDRCFWNGKSVEIQHWKPCPECGSTTARTIDPPPSPTPTADEALPFEPYGAQIPDEEKARIRKTSLYERGDTICVWINEGSLHHVQAQLTAALARAEAAEARIAVLCEEIDMKEGVLSALRTRAEAAEKERDELLLKHCTALERESFENLIKHEKWQEREAIYKSQIEAGARAMLAAAPAAPEAPSDAVCRKIDARARNGKAWLVWWPTVKLDDDGNLTDEVTGGTWLISEYQGHWIEPDCINAIGEWFGDGEEYAAEPTHYMPLPAPPLRPDGQTGGK